MTEKRSDYRKEQSRGKAKNLFGKVKAAFSDQPEDHQNEKVDVNPDFQDKKVHKRPLVGDGEEKYYSDPDLSKSSNLDKGLRLKRRLNSAILIVLVLIVLVLLALFHL